MQMRLARAGILGLSMLAAVPAAALDDLTGTYEGKLSCEFATSNGSGSSSLAGAVYLDDANDGTAFLYLINSQLLFHLAVVSPPDTVGEGRVGGPDCEYSQASGGSVFEALVRAKPGSDKASLRGELLTTKLIVGGSMGVCHFNLKRVSRTIPEPLTTCFP